MKQRFTATDSASPALSTTKTVTITVNQVVASQSYALTVSSDGKVFRYQDGSFTLIAQPFTTALRAVAWKPDGSYALISGDAAVLLKYDGTQLTTIPTGVSTGFNFWTIAWKPDGSYALIGGVSGLVLKYDGTEISSVNTGGLTGTNTIRSTAFNPSSNLALLAGDNGLVMTYDGSTLNIVTAVASNALYSISWSGSTAYIVGGTGTIESYTGGTLAKLPSNTTASFRAITWKPS